jgi:1-hydroxycarotenoid 3,4-desaturase
VAELAHGRTNGGRRGHRSTPTSRHWRMGCSVLGRAPRSNARPARALALRRHLESMSARTEGFPLLPSLGVLFAATTRPNSTTCSSAGVCRPKPTVYVCAQDRDRRPPSGVAARPERLLCLVNAPALGDTDTLTPSDIERMRRAHIRGARSAAGLVLQRSGTDVLRDARRRRDFERLFPATGGALYGAPAHGWRASFPPAGSANAA